MFYHILLFDKSQSVQSEPLLSETLMKHLLAFFLLPFTASAHDLVVYGGTPAGIIAGVAAAREGASVVIIEPTKWIGGMVTGGLTKTDVGKQETIGGYTREFFTRASARYGGQFMWYAEPHANMETFQEMLKEARVEVVTGQRLQSVVTQGANITSLTTEDGKVFKGKQFIDATYEGDLMAQSGVSYIVGRESRDQYGEPLAGYYPMPIRPRTDEVMASGCPCVGGKGPHYIHGTPTRISALDDQGNPLFGVTRAGGIPGSADKLTQSYNFRVVVTKRPDIRVPFPKPEGYAPERYDLLLRLIKAYPAVSFGRLFHLGETANGKFDLNAQGLFSTDYPGGNVDYPDGDYPTRERIWKDHVNHVQGLLWFVANDERVPKALRDDANQWGLCKDEFTDNGHWPYALYVREARRMIGDYVMVQRDCQKEITKPDTVAMGSFLIDCHIVQRIVTEDGIVTDEGSFPDDPARPYQIAYRSLTPKASECANLLVPVCLSASHIACCSLRMEPVYMALGHASGLAAVQAIKENKGVQSIDLAALQAKLRGQMAVLDLPGANLTLASKLPGIVLDDDAATYVGDWTSSNFGDTIDGSSRHDGNADKGRKTATFAIKVPETGRYEVRFAYAPSTNRANNVPVTINHANGSATAVVNETLPPKLDKRFVSLGIFLFKKDAAGSVVIGTGGTNSFVGVDAVQLLRVQAE